MANISEETIAHYNEWAQEYVNMKFDAQKEIRNIVSWIREWFEVNGKDCNVIIGISGGKDSSITAALLVEALGKDRVYGVMMPNRIQNDIHIAKKLIEYLAIHSITHNIGTAFDDTVIAMNGNSGKLLNQRVSKDTLINLAPRLRMSILYAYAQSLNGRVVNTCNLSEDWVGYSTRYGDSIGDFSPLSRYTVTEVKAIGRALGLPRSFVDKVPDDGLSKLSDEDKLGFKYVVLDRYIRTGICEDVAVKLNIDRRHKNNIFKLKLMPVYECGIPIALPFE